VQVVTGAVCHLDAHMVEHALEALDLAGVSRLWIENVGNLVCPAPFACGESRRAVLVSVTEGDDKPEKYPALFATADVLVLSKVDLLPHVDFDPARCVAAARRVRPGLAALACSARSGEGLDAWLAWLGGEGS
jgi:hydrogenase nickel incorporation protein HypB